MKREVMEPGREQEDEALFDPDAALMIRVKNGDMRAFEALVDRYKQSIVNFVYRSVPNSIESEELAQAVFVNVFKAAHRFCPSARFSNWQARSCF